MILNHTIQTQNIPTWHVSPAAREQQKVNPTHHKRRRQYITCPRLYQRESSLYLVLQTALTAQIHKRAWLPSRLKVTLVTRIFRPSTWRLWFLIHALWNVSYTCQLATLMQCELRSVTGNAAFHVTVCHAKHASTTSELQLGHNILANKINAIYRDNKTTVSHHFCIYKSGTNLVNARKV